MTSHQDRLIAFLKKEVGGAGFNNEQVRDFSRTLKETGIIDLSKSSTQEWVTQDSNGQQVLVQLISWYSLGLLTNLEQIIKQTKGK